MKDREVLSLLLLASLFSSFLLSCDSGSESSKPSLGNGGGSTSINPGLKGRLFFQDGDKAAYHMDLESGVYNMISNTNWGDQDTRFPRGTVTFYASPVAYASVSEFAVVARRCKKQTSDILSPDVTCIVIQDFQGNYVAEFDVLYDVLSDAKISPNGEYIALFRELDDDWLEVYDRSGNLVSDFQHDDTSFDWMPDGRLVFADDRRLVFTNPYSADPIRQITLPANITGQLGQLAVSPDGEQIAFSMIDSTNFATTRALPYVIELDSLNVRQLADTPDNSEIPVINDPKWSPDGQSILLAEGVANGQDPNAPGVLGYLYTIPSNAANVMILSTDSGERSSEARLIRFYSDFEDDSTGGIVIDRYPNWGVSWQP